MLIKRRLNVILTKFERYSNVILTLFLRRHVQRHCFEFLQAAAPHLSVCRSTAIIYCLLSLYTANRTFTVSICDNIYENFARCINLFFENRLRRTPLLTRQYWVVFKRRRRYSAWQCRHRDVSI